MSKIKYRFNTKSLTYEKDTISWRKRLSQVLSYLATGLVFATITIILAYKYIDSPKEKQLQREISELTLQYELLNNKMDLVADVLDDIQERDNNIYRTVFEAEPINENIRKAGFGGVDRYKALQGFASSGLMVEATTVMLVFQLF